MKIRLAGIFLLQLLCAEEVLAQTSRFDPNDKQSRYGASLTLDLPKKWEVALGYQARYRNDFQDFHGTYLTIAPQKEIFKNFSVVTEYRIAWLSGATYLRFTAGMNYKRKIEKVKLSLRALVQNQAEEFDDIDKEDKHDVYWRVKLRAQYPIIKRIDLYASVEPVMMVNGRNNTNNFRTTFGLAFKVTRQLDFDVYYLNKQDYDKSYDRVFDILGVSLDYTLKL